jgi:hypothetical protein
MQELHRLIVLNLKTTQNIIHLGSLLHHFTLWYRVIVKHVLGRISFVRNLEISPVRMINFILTPANEIRVLHLACYRCVP